MKRRYVISKCNSVLLCFTCCSNNFMCWWLDSCSQKSQL